jgi:uncharacterized protein
MPKGQRIIVFVATLLLLIPVAYFARAPLSSASEAGVVIVSVLIMLSFTVLLLEHFFTKPTDVTASAIAILLILAPLHGQLEKLGIWYWILISYSALLLLTSILSLFFLHGSQPSGAWCNKLSNQLRKFSAFFGNGRFLWFALFILTLIF